MRMKKILASVIIAGIIGMNFMPMASYAIKDSNKKLTKAEKKLKKAQEEKQNKLNYINIDWWESYNDEYLKGYIYKAIEQNQDVQIATVKVEEARQAAKMQFANELPQVMVGAAPAITKMQNQTKTTGMFAIPIIASYEADIFLKNHDKTKSAKKIYEASQYQEKATYIAIASQVGATYYNIVKLDKLIDLQEKLIKDRKEVFDIKKLSNDEGIISTADLVRAEKAYIMATSDMLDLKKAREIMLNSLAVLIGESPANAKDLKRVSYSEIAELKEVPNEISSEVITARPDYQVAQKMLEKAGIDVRVAKKEFLPTINILGLLGLAASSAGGGMNWANSLMAAGVGAMLPVFTGGSRIANLKMNKAKYQESLLNYQKTNLVAIKEVNDSLATLKLDNEKYIKDTNSLEMEQKDLVLTQYKYEEGIIAKLDLLEKQESMIVTEKLVTNSKVDCLINQISLYKAVAGNI